MLKKNIDYETALAKISTNWSRDPFKILISTILSQRTKDEITVKAANQLFKKFKSPKDLSEAKENVVQELIKPSGFYRIKTKRIIEVAKILLKHYNGEVPNDMNALLSLPSVGRKTANCVLVYGFNIPAIPVDTHVHRISNRLNLVQTLTPEETEAELADKTDKKYWLQINDLFVRFGQIICKPLGPKCNICGLSDLCTYHVFN
jgi:endonuclease-3